MNIQFIDLIDKNKLSDLLVKFNNLTGCPVALFSYPDLKLLFSAGGQQACRDFHHKNCKPFESCITHNKELINSCNPENIIKIRSCPYNLVDGVAPIIVEGKQIAVLLTAQIFIAPPDLDFYRNLAKDNGYDVENYLEAIQKIPVISEDKYKAVLEFISELAVLLAEMSLIRLNLIREQSRKILYAEEKLLKASIELDGTRSYFKTLTEGVEANIYVCNPDRTIDYANKSFKEKYGSNPEGKICHKIVFNSDNICSWCQIDKSIELDKNISVENHNSVDDTWYNIIFSPLNVDNTTSMMVIQQDITESKLFSQALEESEARFRIIFEKAEVGIVMAGIDMKYIMVNRAFEKITGYTAKELRSLTILDITHPDDKHLTIKSTESLLANNHKETTHEKRFIKKDGEVILAKVKPVLVYDENKKPAYFFGMIEDITEQKKAQEAIKQYNELLEKQNTALESSQNDLRKALESLQHSENRYKTLFSNMDEGVVILIPVYNENGALTDLRIEDVNLAYETILGFKKEQVINKLTTEIYQCSPEDLDIDKYEEVLINGSPVFLENFYQTLNKYLSIAAYSPGKDRLAIIFRDITQRKVLEKELANEKENLENKVVEQTKQIRESMQELEEINKKLAEVNKHKTKFLSALSHELRTPLNAVIGFSDLLIDQVYGPLNEKQIRYLQQIIESGLHLTALISDLLDMTRIDSGKTELYLEKISPNLLVSQVINTLEQEMQNKSLKLELYLHNEFDNIKLDKKRFKQIVLNLLSNAIKYTDDKGTITIALKKEDNKLNLSISDTGIGIPEKELDNIFKEFYRVESAERGRVDGLGIGLALTKRLIDLHNGTISLSSKENEGSIFTVLLPIIDAGDSLEFKDITNIAYQDMPRGRKVMIVEDNEVNITLISDYMKIFNHQLIIARNGQESIELAIEHKPDLIFMDIRMPVMDGIEATKRIKDIKDLNRTPIISISASTGEDAIKEQLEAGCDFHISKPINHSELARVLMKYLK